MNRAIEEAINIEINASIQVRHENRRRGSETPVINAFLK